MQYQNESAVVTYFGQLIDATTGTPGSVEFDFDRIWSYIKRRRASRTFHWEPLEFIHVHPPSFGTQYSSTDLNCVQGLVQAFGLKESEDVFRFSIVCFENNNPIDHTVKKTIYVPKGMELVKLAEVENYSNPADYTLALLKIMSYRGMHPEE